MRIKITADENASFGLMFEPSGMLYEMAPGSVMFADVDDAGAAEMEVVYWNGGMSLVPAGPVVTRDADGTELHRLH